MENTTTQTEQTASSETTASETTTQTAEAGNVKPDTGEWYLAEGVQGTGEKPEYFLSDKYASLSEQAKAYPESQKRFGSFTGAPDEYSIAEGVELNAEHPILESIQSFGKENNLSNEGYNNLVNVLLENEKAIEADQQAQTEQVKKDLGPNANERIQNVDDFINANLEANNDMKGLIDLAKGQPGGVELIEAFIGMTKKTGLASEQVAAPMKTYSKEELNTLQFADDSYGNRKMNDNAYRKMVEDYSAKLLAQG